jgi:hypothetical protein
MMGQGQWCPIERRIEKQDHDGQERGWPSIERKTYEFAEVVVVAEKVEVGMV